MLRNLFSRTEPYAGDIVLLHSALTRDAVIFGPELRSYADRGLIRLIELHTDVDGMLDVADLDTIVPDLAERTSYACGPAGLLDALEEHYSARDLTLNVERFRPTTLVAGEGGTVSFTSGAVVEADGVDPDPRRRRERRRPDAQRLPDGHLHGLRDPAEGGCRARPAQRRAHGRRPRGDRARRRTDPDLHQRGRRAVLHRPLI